MVSVICDWAFIIQINYSIFFVASFVFLGTKSIFQNVGDQNNKRSHEFPIITKCSKFLIKHSVGRRRRCSNLFAFCLAKSIKRLADKLNKRFIKERFLLLLLLLLLLLPFAVAVVFGIHLSKYFNAMKMAFSSIIFSGWHPNGVVYLFILVTTFQHTARRMDGRMDGRTNETDERVWTGSIAQST